MRESANDGGVFGRKLGYNVLDPGQHPFDADVDRAQNADRDQEAAQVIVGSVRGRSLKVSWLISRVPQAMSRRSCGPVPGFFRSHQSTVCGRSALISSSNTGRSR